VARASSSRVNAEHSSLRRYPVANPKETIRIKLTDEQKSQIRAQTGKDADAVEFSVEELEERIAPTAKPYKP
jgi:hypothetical protein